MPFWFTHRWLKFIAWLFVHTLSREGRDRVLAQAIWHDTRHA